MEILDGVVIPSFLTVSPSSLAGSGESMSYGHAYLRAGTVIAAYGIEDSRNINKKYVEYDVNVVVTHSGGSQNSQTYRHVIVSSLFGSPADYFHWAPRLESVNSNGLSTGSRVLLLCLEGNIQRGYIIGALPHPNGPKDGKDPILGLAFEYNGVHVDITKDGDLVLTHKGATNPDSTVIDATNGNAQLSMTKDGKVTIGYASSEGDKPQITWDKQADTITIHGNTKVRIEANNGPVEIETGSGVKINDATEAFLRATTYRAKQTELHNTLIQLLEVLANQHSAAGAGLASMPGGPIISSMGTTFNQMKAAIKEFENNDYLSKKHFHED